MADASAASSLGAGADLIFQASPVPMWIYDRATLAFLDVNDAAVEHYGFSRQEFLSRTIAEIRPVEDVDALLRSVSKRQQGWRRSGVWRHQRRNGEVFFAEITAHDCVIDGRDCVMAVAVDVTELHNANMRLERSERRYRELVESLNDVVLTTDLDGHITYVSPNVADYGYQPSDIIGQTFHPLIHADDLPRVIDATQAALAGTPATLEYRVYSASGGTHHFRASIKAMLDDAGQPVGLSGVLADLTEQREVEEQLRVSQRLEAVGRLAGGIAHDFNNLLVVIKGYAELGMHRLEPDDPLCGDLQEILHAGQRAASLTQQLLAFGRRQLLRPDVVDINGIVRGMTSMLERVIGEDIILEAHLDPDLPPVFIDAAQLEHAILNLVLNARDAMPDGGRLEITTSRQSGHPDLAETHRGQQAVVLTISDSGTGMDETIRARVFEPFFTTKPQGQGSGLGLPMVYGFVKQSGGALDLWSEPGAGTRVTIVLGSHLPAPPLSGVPAPAPVQRGTERVLIVEDDAAVRQLVGRVLTSAGYQWMAAGAPGEALALLAERACGFDVLLTDCLMPEMTGAELSQRALVMCPALRVVYMTGYRDVPIAGPAAAGREAPTLTKPFTSAQLTAAIRAALES
jgi:two-component system cell cycle sensor histidine kinase/response regulator CckA